jgi:hypothetical protein
VTGDDVDAPPGDIAPGAWLAPYHYRRPIAVTPGIASTLDSFPLGLVRVSDAVLAAHAAGNDLVVTASDAVTVLDRELVVFGVDGALELWVRVPALGPGPTTLYLYYGGPAATDAPVFSAFTGVWHFGDTSNQATDSSPHGNNLHAANNPTTPAVVPGIAGNARSYDGVDDSMGINDPGNGSLDMGLASFSFSVWVNITASAGLYDTPLWKGGTSVTEKGYCVLTGNGIWNAKVHDGTSYVDPELGTAATLANGSWVHLAGVVDRGAAKTFTAYANGARSDVPAALGNLGTLDNNFAFDVSRPNTTQFRGSIDEVRIYPGVLSADWIQAEHANLADPGFAVFGAEQVH